MRTFVGTLVSFSDASATFHTENGDVTCTRNGSPTLGDFHACDHVKAACTSGVLTAIAKLEPPPAPAPQVVTRLATITSLTDGSVTVRNGDGDLTCTRNATSPSLDGYAVGDHVKATCVNDVLTAKAHL